MNGNNKGDTGENDSFTGCENDDETGKAGRDRLEVRGAKTASCIIRDGDARYDDVVLSRICAFLETSSVTWLLKRPSNDTSNDTQCASKVKTNTESIKTPQHSSFSPLPLRLRAAVVSFVLPERSESTRGATISAI